MTRTFKMIFNDKNKLNEMLELRRLGWTYVSLALIYNVDHSSIYAQCKKRHIKCPIRPISLDISALLKNIEVNVPKDKSYKDYLKEVRNRRFPNLYLKTETI